MSCVRKKLGGGRGGTQNSQNYRAWGSSIGEANYPELTSLINWQNITLSEVAGLFEVWPPRIDKHVNSQRRVLGFGPSRLDKM